MEIFVSTYLIIGIIILATFHSNDIKDGFQSLFLDYVKENNATSILIGCFGLLAYLIVISIILIIFPIFLLIRYRSDMRRKIYVNKKQQQNLSFDSARVYNAGYDKLFFSLTGKYSEPETKQISALRQLFDHYEIFAFPIIYDFPTANNHLFNSTLRKEFNDNQVALFIFDSEKYFDPPGENLQVVFPIFSNTNYCMRPNDIDICASALASICNIDIDGINKFVFCKKENLNEIYVLDFNELIDNELSPILSKLKSSQKIILPENIYELISSYLSLHWTHSKLEEYHNLRESAKIIREKLYYKCRLKETYELINLYKIVGYRKPLILYQLVEPTEEELKIKKSSLTMSLEELKINYPEYDLNKLKQLKEIEVKGVLYNMVNEPLLDFKSKIFLKSSNKIIDYFGEDEIDFSAVTIGYSKFFEREVDLSIVQLIRKKLGIKMPLFYDKYCTDSGNYYVVGEKDFKINFNMRYKRTNDYLPPGLGQSLKSLRILSETLDAKIPHIEILISKGRAFVSIRNKSAHPDLVNINDVKELQEIIVELYIKGTLGDLFQIKKELSN